MTTETNDDDTNPIKMAELLIKCIEMDKKEFGMHLEMLGWTLMFLGCETVTQLGEAIYRARCEWDL